MTLTEVGGAQSFHCMWKKGEKGVSDTLSSQTPELLRVLT